MSHAASSILRTVTGLFIGALLLHAPALASDKASGKSEDAVRVAWAKLIRHAQACDVRHYQNHPHPVAFTTRMPSEWIEKITYADGMLQWDGNDPIAEMLASLVEGPVIGGRDPPACEDSTGGDLITLKFGSGKSALRLEFGPIAGTLNARDGKGHLEFYDLDNRTGELLALLAHTIPSDWRLAKIMPCPGRTSALGVAATLPDANSFYPIDQLPSAVDRMNPTYPEEAKRSQLEGTVIVEALVDTLGHVARTRIRQLNPVFDEPAVRAVEQWKFRPGTLSGRPVPVWVAVPVKFSLH